MMIEMATGIAQGMNYLHSLEKKIIHRDLKVRFRDPNWSPRHCV